MMSKTTHSEAEDGMHVAAATSKASCSVILHSEHTKNKKLQTVESRWLYNFETRVHAFLYS